MSTFFKALEQAERDRSARAGQRVDDFVEPDAPAVRRADRDEAVMPPDAAVGATWPELRGPAAVTERAASEMLDPWGQIDEHLVSLLRPSSPEAEHYRALRHTLHHLRQTTGLTVVAVSSPSPGDGRTTTAINAAGALAQAPESRVLLVDLDLRHAGLAQRLGGPMSTGPGVVEAVLVPTLSLRQVVRRHAAYNLDVVPAGSVPPRPDEVVASPRLGVLLEEARRQYDYVVIDTPPIVSSVDARVLGQWVDGFLLVVAADRTPRRLLEEALNLMEPSKVVGLVFQR